ncbi:MAG: hypothetical protein ACI840_001270 [Ulvibacter sp.]|jgi:hypothetical protein
MYETFQGIHLFHIERLIVFIEVYAEVLEMIIKSQIYRS